MVEKRTRKAGKTNGREELQKKLARFRTDETAQKKATPWLKKAMICTVLLVTVQTALCLGVAEYMWQKQNPDKPSPFATAFQECGSAAQKGIFEHWQDLTSAVRAKQRGGEAEAAARSVQKKESAKEQPKVLKIAERGSDQEALCADVSAILAEKASDCSIFLLRPREEKEPLLYQSHAMQPASMIKLFVLVYAMQQEKDGTFSLAEPLSITEENIVGGAGQISWYDRGKQLTAEQLLERMITDSDNTATNILIDRLGIENIDGYIRQKGYGDTRLQHKMMLSNHGLPNLSSVKDIGTLLSRIYCGECVDYEHDEKMLQILARQKDKECLPAALPAFLVANKTGEVRGIYADGGIAWSEAGDLILVVMDENSRDRTQTIALFQQIAQRAAASL